VEPLNQASNVLPERAVDARAKPRFKLAVDIRINSKTCGLLRGQTVDISESGVSAILMIEVPMGELVELEFPLPFGAVTVYATVRQRSAFRYGFQFVQTPSAEHIIHSTCRSLQMKQDTSG
jgi:hypothetical protein